MQSFAEVVSAFMFIAIVMLAARGLRRHVPLWERFHLPSSVLAGLIALCLGPQVCGRLYPAGSLLSHGIFPVAITEVWRHMPGVLISFVFAGIFIGRPLPAVKTVWREGAPRAALGFSISFGQLALGMLAVILLLSPRYGMNPLYGALVEISMSGGHGVVAGLNDTFSALKFEEGRDFALGLATVGLLTSLTLGTLFINCAVRRKNGAVIRERRIDRSDRYELTAVHDNEPIRPAAHGGATDPLTLHLALLVTALVMGQLLRQGLGLFERFICGPLTGELLRHLPLFPMAMAGGMLLQLLLQRWGKDRWVSRELIDRICGFSLDCIIVAALATLSLSVIVKNWPAFLILSLAGTVWTLFCFYVLAPRLVSERWFENGLADFGQGTGGLFSGLLLLRMADPGKQSGAFESYAGKQVLFQGIMGGGLVSALAVPLCMRWGPLNSLVVFAAATLLSVGFGAWAVRRAPETPENTP